MRHLIDFTAISVVPGFREGEQYDTDIALIYAQELQEQGFGMAVLTFCDSEIDYPQLALASELGNEVKSRFGDNCVIGPLVLVDEYVVDGNGTKVAVDRLYHGAAMWQKKSR